MKSELLCLSLLLTASVKPRAEDPTPPAPAREPFKLELKLLEPAPPGASGKIPMGDKVEKSLLAVLTNTSDETQPVFRTSNSWGYDNIRLECKDADGKVSTSRLRPGWFTVNFPGVFPLAPGKSHDYPIALNRQWEGLPVPPAPAESMGVTLRLVYEVKESREEEARAKNVWVGKVCSAWEKCELITR